MPGSDRVVGIIPARMGSTRFPGKVLACETGRPLIRHVYENAARASSLGRLVVATDDERVRAAVAAFGGECVLTRADHANGTSRLGEAAEKLGLRDNALVVNIQGDEPELEPEAIDRLVALTASSPAEVGTLASPFAPGEDPANPAIVKIVLRRDGTALYFSRARIPYPRSETPHAGPLKHIGVYAYRVAFLRVYPTLAPTPLELAESLEQLRALEHGYRIAAAVTRIASHGIDTPEQYAAFVGRWREGGAQNS